MGINEYVKFFSDKPKGYKFGYWEILTIDIIKFNSKAKILCRCTNCYQTTTFVRCENLLQGASTQCNNCRKNKLKLKGQIYKGISPLVFNKIKSSAKNRNLEFNITIEEIGDLFEKQKRKCALTGIELILKKNLLDNKATASLDRKDSKKGYILENVHWTHKDVNKMKMDFDLNYFYYLIQASSFFQLFL